MAGPPACAVELPATCVHVVEVVAPAGAPVLAMVVVGRDGEEDVVVEGLVVEVDDEDVEEVGVDPP